jgi:hypothetical protein
MHVTRSHRVNSADHIQQLSEAMEFSTRANNSCFVLLSTLLPHLGGHEDQESHFHCLFDAFQLSQVPATGISVVKDDASNDVSGGGGGGGGGGGVRQEYEALKAEFRSKRTKESEKTKSEPQQSFRTLFVHVPELTSLLHQTATCFLTDHSNHAFKHSFTADVILEENLKSILPHVRRLAKRMIRERRRAKRNVAIFVARSLVERVDAIKREFGTESPILFMFHVVDRYVLFLEFIYILFYFLSAPQILPNMTIIICMFSSTQLTNTAIYIYIYY